MTENERKEKASAFKKIVVITGSPRKDGNSNRMADSFIHAALKAKFAVTRFDSAYMNIGVCHACDKCFSNGNACVGNDDFNKVAAALMEADAVILVSPVYWYTFPAQIKSIIDKMYSFCVADRDFSGKKCALISCCEENGIETFNGIRFAYEQTMKLMKCESVDEILIPGVNRVGEIENTDGEKRAADLSSRLFS